MAAMTAVIGTPGYVLRRLDPVADLTAVADVYRRSADYLLIERGDADFAAAALAFFAERPPVGEAICNKMGVCDADGRLVALVDLVFGYPEPDDAYLGLLMIAEDARGCGLGTAILKTVKAFAGERSAPRLLLGVLDENRRARAFWERQGFAVVRTSGPHKYGVRTHVVHRMELPLIRR